MSSVQSRNMLQKFTIILLMYDKYDFYRNTPSSQLIMLEKNKRNVDKLQDSK